MIAVPNGRWIFHKPDAAVQNLTLRAAGLATGVRHLVTYSGTLQQITRDMIGGLLPTSGRAGRGTHLESATIRCRIDFESLSKFRIIKQTD